MVSLRQLKYIISTNDCGTIDFHFLCLITFNLQQTNNNEFSRKENTERHNITFKKLSTFATTDFL